MVHFIGKLGVRPARLVGAVVCAALLAASSFARAAVVTFDGTPGALTGVTAEGMFSYDEFSGTLERYATGNPANSVGGQNNVNGGILRVVRNDAPGLFTFDAADVATFGAGLNGQILIRGYLAGVLQATDLFTNVTSVFATFASNNLAGLHLDELRIYLDAQSGGNNHEAVDNLVLTAVPEPHFLGLCGVGSVLLVVVGRRRRSARSA